MKGKCNKTLGCVNWILERSRDVENINRCKQNLNEFSRYNAWVCLQDMIREYWLEMEALGRIFEDIKIFYNVKFHTLSDDKIKAQIKYIEQRIPIYVLMRQSARKLVLNLI